MILLKEGECLCVAVYSVERSGGEESAALSNRSIKKARDRASIVDGLVETRFCRFGIVHETNLLHHSRTPLFPSLPLLHSSLSPVFLHWTE